MGLDRCRVGEEFEHQHIAPIVTIAKNIGHKIARLGAYVLSHVHQPLQKLIFLPQLRNQSHKAPDCHNQSPIHRIITNLVLYAYDVCI
jgi:hypothetical protein